MGSILQVESKPEEEQFVLDMLMTQSNGAVDMHHIAYPDVDMQHIVYPVDLDMLHIVLSVVLDILRLSAWDNSCNVQEYILNTDSSLHLV